MLTTFPPYLVITTATTFYVATTGSDTTGNGTSGSPWATLTKAIQYLSAFRLLATTTVQVANGTYTHSDEIRIDHPDGYNLVILGNTTTPTSAKLLFSNHTSGIAVRNSNRVGFVNGFLIEGTWLGSGTTDANLAAIMVESSGSINIGPAMRINKFYYGLSAVTCGYIGASGTSDSVRVEITNAGDAGVLSTHHGMVYANYIYVNGSSDTTNNWGCGIVTENGGTFRGTDVTLTNNRIAGLLCIGGNMQVDSFNVDSNQSGAKGVHITRGGRLDALGTCTSDGNAYGIYTEQGILTILGSVSCDSNTVSGLYAYESNVLIGSGSTFSSNTSKGVHADFGSNVVLFVVTINLNPIGVSCYDAKVHLLFTCTVSNSSTVGIEAYGTGKVFNSGSTMTSNTVNYSPPVNSYGHSNSLIDDGTNAFTNLSVTPGTGMGTTPTVDSTANTRNTRFGKLKFTTGTTPAAGATIATITFPEAFNRAPLVVFNQGNQNAAALGAAFQPWIETTTTTMVLKSGTSALLASTAYEFNYAVYGD